MEDAVVDRSGQPAAHRRWVPVLVVVALIGLVVGGAQVLSAAVAEHDAPPVQIGTAVRIQPRPGWDVQSVTASPPTARLHRGPVILAVFAMDPEPLGPGAVADRYVEEQLGQGLSQLAVATQDPTTLAGGVPAVRFAYVGFTSDGRSVEGVVVAATTDHAAAVFDASAPGGEIATVAEDLRAMVEHAVID
jgi:hypothetical protein